jgi:ABC-type transport system substrate-binding protein
MRGGIGAKSWAAALSVTAMAVLFAGCSGAAATPTARSGGAVVTFGELANSPPTYIFPMESGTYFTNQNLYQFSNQLYVPLYSFGDQGQPVLNPELSVASSPVFSDNNTVVSITLKHWQWSNGQPITSRDVIFWMNLLSAVTDPNSPAVGSTSAPGPGWIPYERCQLSGDRDLLTLHEAELIVQPDLVPSQRTEPGLPAAGQGLGQALHKWVDRQLRSVG